MTPIPVPTPFPLPTPDPGLLDTSPLWDYNNLAQSVSALQTVFALIEQNYLATVIVMTLLIALIIGWLASFVASRGNNV